jgi:hypothetical protein
MRRFGSAQMVIYGSFSMPTGKLIKGGWVLIYIGCIT